MASYVGLFTRHSYLHSKFGDSPEDILDGFKVSENYGNIFPIIIFNEETKEIYWFKHFLGIEECTRRMNEFFEHRHLHDSQFKLGDG